tara:strand:+ start:13911 stop:14639 length:729 start_codon:yes stop_codon:yes gene_type:complete
MAITYDAPSASSNWDNIYVIETLPTIFPQAGDSVFTAIVVKKICVQKKSKYSVPSLGSEITGYDVPGIPSTNPLYTNLTLYLYEETEPEDIGGGLCKFTQSYGTTPTDYSSTSIEVVTFPGYYSEWDADNPVSPATSVYRPPLSKLVEVKEDHSFVLSLDPISGSGSVLTPTQVMTIQNPQKEYVDYVDDNTIDRDGTSLTYANYQTMVLGGEYFVFKPPVLQRAYGAGYVWELIEYTTKAI